MDLISTAASIIAILQLSSDVVKYIIGATGAAKARRSLREEILSCEFVLLQIQDHLDDADGGTVWSEKIKTLEGPGTPLYRLGIALEALKSQLEPKKGWNKALSALKWPFDEKEVEKFISTIQREKSLLQLALTNNCIKLMEEIKEASDQNHVTLLELVQTLRDQSIDSEGNATRVNTALLELQESQGYVMAGLGDLHEHHVNVKQQVILDWITPIDYTTQQSDFINRRQAGTGKWLLNSTEFQLWMINDNHTLFCPGIPGAGKTILTSVVVDNLHAQFDDNLDVGIAHLYCNFRRADDQKAEDLLASLLKQLVQQRCSLPDTIISLYNLHRKKREKPTFDEILSTLRSIVDMYSRVFIVIDALDECPAYTSSRLLSEIFILQTACAANIFATSRFIPEIMERFKYGTSLEIRASKQDICAYIDGHMLHLPSFVKRSCELQEEIKTEIFNAADGMFLLAKLHLESLVGKRSIKAVRTALKKLPSGSNALYQAYKEAMKRIESQVSDQIELANQVLLWIACAKRPLTTLELQHALAVEVGKTEIDPDNFPQVEDMVSVCAGLVTVDEESSIIRLVHHTTQEYFEQTQEQWFPNADANIALVCITYLSFNIFDAGFCQTDFEFEESLLSNSFYDYAAHNWGHHARGVPIEVNDSIMDFLQNEPKLSRCSQTMMAAKDYNCSNRSQNVPRQITGMHLAAYFGLQDILVALLSLGNEPDIKDTHGRTPLSYAAARGHEAVVTLLLANHAVNPDSKDSIRGWTPLWYAVVGIQVTVVKRLLEDKAVDPNSVSIYGKTPLLWAAERGHDAIVKLLVENDRVHLDAIDFEYGCTPLSWAAVNGHDAVIKLLLNKADVNPDHKDIEYGRTPLSWAAERGHRAVVEALLTRNEVDVDSKSKYGRTPLWFSKERGHEEIVELLLANNAVDPGLEYSEYGQIPLWYAAEIGQEAIVKLLLENGVDPNSKSQFGRTPLSYAAEKGHEAIVRLLLGNDKVGPDLKDCEYGRTPLSWAAANGHESVVKLLLQEDKVDPDSKSKYGTPLSWAARFGREAVVRLLLAKDDVDPDSKCDRQRTPLSYAAEKGHEAIVKLLLERGEVKPGSRDSKYGRTPLLWARVNGHEGTVKLLRESCYM
ncbi:ankyrin repeat-containing domain protein [Xylaria sp. FL1777]|nr:ankyrin repeat-containing domain protein [Xylaria sp. FL1777]